MLLMGKMFAGIDPEIGIRKVVYNKNKDTCLKTGLYKSNQRVGTVG
jgi:hypothetical protein